MSERTLNLKSMGEIQDILNEHTVTEWRKNLNVNDFKTAMFAEFAELLESASWQWWKKHAPRPDDWNLKIEAIDVVHFALSIFILKGNIDNHKDMVMGQYNTDHNYMINNDMIDRNVFINKTCELLTSDEPCALDDLLDSLGMQAEEISAIYTAKSELNFIRQDEGYKNGTYIKIKDGIEDNVKLEGLVQYFLFDPVCTLDRLRQNVREAFYEQAQEEEEAQVSNK